MTRLRVPPLLLAGALACGPSFQAVYECDVRFEHCYAVDQGVATGDLKKECWREWLREYTYGQPRDRVEYAATRFSELSLDPTLPSEDVKALHPRATRLVAASMPTDAFKPPPNVIDGHDAGAAAPEDVSAAQATPGHDAKARAPGADCAATCGHRWTTCRGSCKVANCDACDRAYRGCMPACFR